jgi:predicted Zn finger-like uncharacterized protein
VIVECSNCQTRFQLDDSRVPARGIRVRCSRCKEAFFLENPNASRADSVQDAAENAVSASAAPDATQDLGPDSFVAEQPELRDPDDDEDWEFNEEPTGFDSNDASDTAFMDPAEEPSDAEIAEIAEIAEAAEMAEMAEDGASAEEAQVPGLGIDGGPDDDEWDDEESGLDLHGAPPSDLGAAEDVPADLDEGSGAESDFGEVSDFSQPSDAEASLASAAAPAAPAAQVALSGEDVGEPEDWDFFSDESLEQPSTFESMDNAMGRAMDAVEADTTGESASGGPDLASVRARAKSRGGLRSLGHALGWMLTLGLLAVGISGGVFDLVPQHGLASAVVDLGDFEARQLRGSWLETARSTRLYAVTGQLVNDSDRARSPGSGLSLVLLSEDGHRLDVPAARAGAPISEARLRELSAEDLAYVVDESVGRLAWLRLEPGQAATFQAVVDGVPDEATNFTLELTEAPAPLAPPAATEFSHQEPLEPLASGGVEVLDQAQEHTQEQAQESRGDVAPASDGRVTTESSRVGPDWQLARPVPSPR